jgi:hypothetical protein
MSGTYVAIKHRGWIQTILTFLIVVALVVSVSAQTNSAAITWYTGGNAKISLAPIAIDNSPSVLVAGTTSQKMIIVTVAKKKGPSRSNPIPVAADGSFNIRYLIKDGPGTYTITLSGSEHSGSLNYQGLGFFTHTVTKSLPANLLNLELNGKIIEYVDKVMGTTVGRGECWDLAQEALDQNLADWTRPVRFGRPLNPARDEIKAGDIIQFRSVKITEHPTGGVTRYESLGSPDHTAIVYKVLGKKQYTVAHQNVRGNRNVITGEINLSKISGGKFWIYRPVALMIQQ